MDPKRLRKQYMRYLPDLNKTLEYVNSQLSDLSSSEFTLETNIKPYASVKRKMEKDNIQDPKELSDLVRGRLYFSQEFDHDQVINILKILFKDYLQKIDRKTSGPTEYGLQYCDVTHIDLNIDGIRFELQVLPLEFKPYKEFLHQIYEKFRNPKISNKLTENQQDLLRKVHNRLYEKLHEQVEARSKED